MILKKGNFYYNMTAKYLAIVFKHYGKELTDRLYSLTKLAVGINDSIIPNTLNLNRHLFILVDTQKNTKQFLQILEWLKENGYLSFDYPFDDLENGYQHMIVIKIPNKYTKAFEEFKNSNYSKMYSEEQLKELFPPKDERLTVLRRDYSALENFLKIVKKEYDIEIRPVDWEGEADFPIFLKDEIFNYKLKKQNNGKSES